MAEDGAVNKSLFLSTEDNKYSANFEVFANRVSLTVFENQAKAAPIIKHMFTYVSIVQFEVACQKVLSDPEAKPINIGSHPWNRDLKIYEFKSSVSIGRDNEKCIYFDLAGDKHKEPIRFYLNSDKSMRVNEMEPSKHAQTEAGLRTVIRLVPILMTECIRSPIQRRDQNITKTSVTPITPTTGEDVLF